MEEIFKYLNMKASHNLLKDHFQLELLGRHHWYNPALKTAYIGIREARPYQNWWIFGKVPKGGGHFWSKKKCCSFFCIGIGGVISYLKKIVAIFFAFERIFGKNRNIFPEKGAGGGSKAVWNFSKNFGRDGLPLGLQVYNLVTLGQMLHASAQATSTLTRRRIKDRGVR